MNYKRGKGNEEVMRRKAKKKEWERKEVAKREWE